MQSKTATVKSQIPYDILNEITSHLGAEQSDPIQQFYAYPLSDPENARRALRACCCVSREFRLSALKYIDNDLDLWVGEDIDSVSGMFGALQDKLRRRHIPAERVFIHRNGPGPIHSDSDSHTQQEIHEIQRLVQGISTLSISLVRDSGTTLGEDHRSITHYLNQSKLTTLLLEGVHHVPLCLFANLPLLQNLGMNRVTCLFDIYYYGAQWNKNRMRLQKFISRKSFVTLLALIRYNLIEWTNTTDISLSNVPSDIELRELLSVRFPSLRLFQIDFHGMYSHIFLSSDMKEFLVTVLSTRTLKSFYLSDYLSAILDTSNSKRSGLPISVLESLLSCLEESTITHFELTLLLCSEDQTDGMLQDIQHRLTNITKVILTKMPYLESIRFNTKSGPNLSLQDRQNIQEAVDEGLRMDMSPVNVEVKTGVILWAPIDAYKRMPLKKYERRD